MATEKLNIVSTDEIPSIEEYAAQLVATAPPLSTEQVARIRYLIESNSTVSEVAA